MTDRIQHTVVTLLLVSYLFVGAAAHLDAFNQLLGLGDGPQKVARTKPTEPIPKAVCWTQYKHIPSITKIAPAPPAVISPAEWPEPERCIRLSAPDDIITHQARINIQLPSRSPPSFAAAS